MTLSIRPVAICRLLLLTCVAFALSATSALAATYYQPAGEFGDAGSGDGQFSAPRDVAVESDTGNVLVVDRDNDRVQVLAPGSPLSYLTQFGTGVLDDPVGIAIDQDSGDVYVTSSASNEIVKFESDGQPTPTYTQDAGFTSPAQGSAAGEIGAFDIPIAVDPSSGDLLVADRANGRVSRYNSDGSYDDFSFDGWSSGDPFAQNALLDIAVDSSGDIVVVNVGGGASIGDVVNGSPSRVVRFDSTGATAERIGTSLPSVGAVAVDPDTDEVAIAANLQSWNNSQPLRVHIFSADGTSGPDYALGGNTLWSVVPGLAIGGGAAGRLYAVTDQFSGFGDVSVQAFDPVPPGAPEATTGNATELTASSARISGTVDPNAAETTYYVEYGDTAAYGSRMPLTGGTGVPGGVEPRPIRLSLFELEQETTYHYRVVAQSSEGTDTGDDRTFRTASTAAPPASARRYEMVSPPDKNGTDIYYSFSDLSNSRASLSGDRVTFASAGAFAGQPQAKRVMGYLADRTAAGWRTKPTSPPIAPFTQGSQLGSTADLSKLFIYNQDPPLVPGAQNTRNLYMFDVDSGSYELLTPTGGDPATLIAQYLDYADSTENGSHVLFHVDYPLLPGDPVGVTNLYLWHAGELELVGVREDDSPASAGALAGPAVGPDANGYFFGRTDAFLGSTLSEDGRRVFWTDLADGALYLREDGSTTVKVSATQRTTPDPEGTKAAVFRGATPDGSKVVFTSSEKLTDDSTATDPNSGGAGPDLYLYDVDSGELTDLSISLDSGGSGGAAGILGMSDDGSRIYFAAKGRLSPDAPPVATGDAQIYLWEEGDLTHVATIGQDFVGDEAALNAGILRTQQLTQAKWSRVTPDGRIAIFGSVRRITDYDADGTRQFYRYDAELDSLTCVSCNPRAAKSSFDAAFAPDVVGGSQAAFDIVWHRTLTDDGSRVFFNTREAMVTQDTNGATDVYEWDDGVVRLVSSGTGTDGSFFMDATPDGRDVFFTTRSRLVGWDEDVNVDLYDARIGGGFPEPGAGGKPPCQGDGCQGEPAAQPDRPNLASGGLRGAGDVTAGRRAAFSLARLSGAQRAKLARGGSVAVKVRVNRAGRVSAVARAKVGGRQTTVARASRRAGRAGTVRLRLRLVPSARRTLARGDALRVSLAVRFSGANAPQRLALQLRRAK